MNRRQSKIILISAGVLFIAFAVLEVVYNHTFEMLTTYGIILGIFGVFCALAYLSRRGTPSFKKMIDSLPAEHKLVTGHIAAIDIGNFRFLYRVYVKSMGPAAKSYVSMEVGVPFPEEEVEKGEYTARESIKWELQTLIDNLLEKGILTDYSPIVQENTETEDAEALQGEEATHITWLGQVMRLEFLQKSISAEKLAEVQGKILGIIDKYRLQDVSWCVRCARDYGSEYRYYKGNLLQSTVWYRHPLDMGRSDYKLLAQLYTGADESLCAVDVYLDKYQMALRSLGKDDIKMSDVPESVELFFCAFFFKVFYCFFTVVPGNCKGNRPVFRQFRIFGGCFGNLIVSLICHIILQHIQNEPFLYSLPHTVYMKRMKRSITPRFTK